MSSIGEFDDHLTTPLEDLVLSLDIYNTQNLIKSFGPFKHCMKIMLFWLLNTRHGIGFCSVGFILFTVPAYQYATAATAISFCLNHELGANFQCIQAIVLLT